MRFLQLYRSRLGSWMRADRAAGDDVARDGGCWGGPYRAPGVTFDNGRRLVVLPALLQSEVGCRHTHPPNYTPPPALLRRELGGAQACLLMKTTYPPPPTLEHPPSAPRTVHRPAQVAGQGVCYRLQLPLKPAWAVTIHKSQGMSLDAAAVQVHRSFATRRPPLHPTPRHTPPTPCYVHTPPDDGLL